MVVVVVAVDGFLIGLRDGFDSDSVGLVSSEEGSVSHVSPLVVSVVEAAVEAAVEVAASDGGRCSLLGDAGPPLQAVTVVSSSTERTAARHCLAFISTNTPFLVWKIGVYPRIYFSYGWLS